ncbi:MAG: helix-turn-helix transcriptional regulator [Eubacteriales bacterium]|nr:helix-turn-helix transcriptional regulator [Eubacteriales bacterium]
MPKISTRENKNIYFKAREALNLTRDEASELLEVIPPEAIEKIENERRKPYPEEVVRMADKYGNPELCNYYCSQQCDIGKKYVPEVKIKDLSQIILEMLASLNSMHRKQERLIEITADGEISNDEMDDFIAIQDDLEKISITVETLQLWSEQMLASGNIDVAAYEARRKKG